MRNIRADGRGPKKKKEKGKIKRKSGSVALFSGGLRVFLAFGGTARFARGGKSVLLFFFLKPFTR